MMNLTFTQQKKPTSSLIPARHSQQDHQATFQPPRTVEIPPQLGFGHEFGQVDVQSGGRTGQQFASSCPLSFPTPRACPFGGACHSCPAPIQTKLTISQPGDRYEQEADRVADAVMTMPEPRNGQRLQRECAECDDEVHRQAEEEEEEEEVATKLIQRQAEPGGPEEEEEETVSPQAQPGRTPQVTPEVATSIHSLRSGGRPLDPATRAFFEPRFGHDFSRVRVHADSKAADTAQAVSARAFTVGRDVVFGAGQYAPDTSGGRRLLAHELAHVVQQGGKKVRPSKSIQGSSIAARSAPQTTTMIYRSANTCTYGEIRSWAIKSVKDFSVPAGLPDAKASIGVVCTSANCTCISGASAKAPGDKAAWKNIVAASGGRDRSGGGNYMCVDTQNCWFVHSCWGCDGNKKRLKKRAAALNPLGQTTVTGKGTLYFYEVPYKGWCNRSDYITACKPKK